MVMTLTLIRTSLSPPVSACLHVLHARHDTRTPSLRWRKVHVPRLRHVDAERVGVATGGSWLMGASDGRSLEKLGLVVEGKGFPQMQKITIREEFGELAFTMQFQSKDTPFTTW